MKKKFYVITIILGLIGSITLNAQARQSKENFSQEKEFLIQIKDHKFTPEIIEVEANKKFKLVVENLDKTTEEFESVDLHKEKIVTGGKKIVMMIAPLKAGEYEFVGEFHAKTARGKIIAK